MADIEKVNNMSISDIEAWNGLTDADIEKLNAINWSGSFAIGTWTAESDALASDKYGGGMAGTASSGLYFGGWYPQSVVTEEWGGSAWSSGGNLNLTSHGCNGTGTQSAAIKISGDTDYTGSRHFDECETYDGSSWTSTTNTNVNHSQGAVGGASYSNCVILCGEAEEAEKWNGSTWTTGATTTTNIFELMGGQSGGAGDVMAAAGNNGSGTFYTVVQKYEYNSGSDDAWSSLAAFPVATSSGGTFGNTNSADVVAFLGKTAAAGDGVASTYEFNGGAWGTGNNLTRARRTIVGTGPTGNGLTAGGYDGSFRDYVDSFSRAVST